MQNSDNDIRASLKAARIRIANLFADQCETGDQTKELNDPLLAACGQFIGPKASHFKQKGLHGTAAAIRVLADSDLPNSGSLVSRLIQFLESAHSPLAVKESPN